MMVMMMMMMEERSGILAPSAQFVVSTE